MPNTNSPEIKTLTRDDLKQVLQANVDAFMQDPDFYEYLTELIIYLMQYEFAWPEGADQSGVATDRATGKPMRFELLTPIGLKTGASPISSVGKRCPGCGVDSRGRKTCPHCQSQL